MDFVTVLKTDKHLCKSISGNPGNYSVSEYDQAYLFEAAETPVESLDDLASILELMASNPHYSLVRGALTEYGHATVDRGQTIRRTIRERDSLPPTIMDAPRHWMMVDIDQYQIVTFPGDEPEYVSNPTGLIERMIYDSLPPEFHDATCYWQWSSTCGFRQNVAKAHVWYWLDHPVTSADLKRWAKSLNLPIDHSVYVPHQLHYTADARLAPGVIDPIGDRHGWLLGARDTVDLTIAPEATSASPTSMAVQPGDYAPDDVAILITLMRIGDGAHRDGFHAPLRKAAYLYALQVRGGSPRDDKAMVALMRSMTLAAPCSDGRAQDRARPSRLQSLITSAFEVVR